MARDLTRQWFHERYLARRPELHGQIVSRFKLTPFDPAGTMMPVADVLISGTLISNVPMAANNRDLLYAAPNTPVTLARSASGRLEVTGLSKRGVGNVYTYTYQIPEFTPETSGGLSTLTTGLLTSVAVIGYSTRVCELGELASATTNGFGETPLEALLLIDATDTIVSIVGN